MGFYKVIEGCYPRVERMYGAWGGLGIAFSGLIKGVECEVMQKEMESTI